MEPDEAEGCSRSCEEARKRWPTQASPCGGEAHDLYRSCSAPDSRSQHPIPASATDDDAISNSILIDLRSLFCFLFCCFTLEVRLTAGCGC